MKINNNFVIGNLNNNLKAKKTNITKTEIQQTEQQKVDAQYYRANYGVAFKGQTRDAEYVNLYFPAYSKDGELKQLNIVIPNSKGKNLPLILKGESLKYVLNEQGEVDAKKLNDYSTLFKRFFIERQAESLKRAKFYEALLQDFEETFGHHGETSEYSEEPQIDTLGMTEEEIAEYCPDKADSGFGRKKEEYAELAQQYRKNAEYEPVSNYAKFTTEQYFRVMAKYGKTDISFVDANERLYEKYADVQENKCGSRFFLFPELIKCSEKYTKTYDIQFMNRILDVMRETSIGYDKKSFLETVSVIQDILAVDKENEENVFAGFIDFIKVYQEPDLIRKNIFMNVFNPVTKKYDEEALKVLKEKAVEIVGAIYTEDLMEKNSIKDIDLAEQEIIKEYFEFIRDEETGEITQNQPNIEIFASARISKYLKV